ncbi:MAG: hypothetical protein AB7T07_03245 [Steroidobacteraceae bacterium]
MTFQKTSPSKNAAGSPLPAKPRHQTSVPNSVPGSQRQSTLPQPDKLENDTGNKGFDPYNSGAFDRRHTWERVNRK